MKNTFGAGKKFAILLKNLTKEIPNLMKSAKFQRTNIKVDTRFAQLTG